MSNVRAIAEAASRLRFVRQELSRFQDTRSALQGQIEALDTSPIPSDPSLADVSRAFAAHNYTYTLADFDRKISALQSERDRLAARLSELQST
jgi:prefoldin subunit 5